MVKTLADLLANQAPVAERPALLFEDQVYTYAELEALSNRVAHVLIGQGLQPGDIVCQVVRNCPELITNLFGVLKSGAIYAPLNPSLTERELAVQLTDCRPSIVITDEELAERTVASAAAGLPDCRIWPVGVLATQARKMSASPPDRSIDLEGPALLFYTSGTTGRSKGVQLSHRNVLTNGRQVLARTGGKPHDRAPGDHANFSTPTPCVTKSYCRSWLKHPSRSGRGSCWRSSGPAWLVIDRLISRQYRRS
jgi:acyl-CoA synthetase (AMP-forming)/AMP-acid ligase II